MAATAFSVAAGPSAASSGEGSLPQPPFGPETPYGGGAKVKCFFGGCNTEASTYLSLMMHINIKHETKCSAFKTTYFYAKFREEKAAKKRVCKPAVEAQPGLNPPSPQVEVDEGVAPPEVGDRGATAAAESTSVCDTPMFCGNAKLLTLLEDKACAALESGDLTLFEYFFEKAATIRGGGQRAPSAPLAVQPACSKPTAPNAAPASEKPPPEAKTDQPRLVGEIRRAALEYKRPTDEEIETDTRRRRFTWPCSFDDITVDLGEVLAFVRQTTKTPGTAAAYSGGLRQWFSIFHFPAECTDPVEAFKIAYNQKLMHRAMDLDILHPSITSTRKIHDGLTKLISFVILTGDDRGDSAAVRYAHACTERFVKPLKKKITDEKEKQRIRREALDTIRLASLPEMQSRNALVKRVMIDIAIVYAEYIEDYLQGQDLPRIARRSMNSSSYGVHAFRSFLGRPGEWKRMMRTKIQACVDEAARTFVEITDHKTITTSGVLGRSLPADVKWTFGKLVALGAYGRNLLYIPTGTSDYVAIHRLAHDFACMYTPGRTSPEPTLMRKECETAVANPDNAAKAKIMSEIIGEAEGVKGVMSAAAAMSGHSNEAQGKYYNLNSTNPKKHALTSEAYIEAFIGPIVEPPTDEDVAANAHRTAEIILSEFKAATSRNTKGGEDGSDYDEGWDDSSDDDVGEDPHVPKASGKAKAKAKTEPKPKAEASGKSAPRYVDVRSYARVVPVGSMEFAPPTGITEPGPGGVKRSRGTGTARALDRQLTRASTPQPGAGRNRRRADPIEIPDDENKPRLSKADELAICKHGVTQRGDGFLGSEKTFIVEELRKKQTAADAKLPNYEIAGLIGRGIKGNFLRVRYIDDHKYLEKVRSFIGQFLSLRSQEPAD